MYYSSIIFDSFIQFFLNFWWLFLIAAAVNILKTPSVKGWFGEAFVRLSMTQAIPRSSEYTSLHNVTLPTHDGTTQIDHIIVSTYGVFVIETKNMKGWIYGSERQATWTQKIYKKSYRFQNPLRQNYKHVKALEAILSIPAEHIHSVIVFVGNCKLKTKMPDNVTYGNGYSRYINSFFMPIFNEQQVQDMISDIEYARYAPSLTTNRHHVENLKKRDTESNSCPKCGNDMVLRTAKRGAKAGSKFWGCSGFPNCRKIVPYKS